MTVPHALRRATVFALISMAAAINASSAGAAVPAFEPTWKSLHGYEVPAWFRDAKFGIFLHWGVVSVPAHDGWYARHMYLPDNPTYAYHVEHYGHPSKFGFKDFIPLWTAKNWDPDALVRLFKESGARYIVPVAVHHDNFDNYASKFQPWNSVNLGPHRDVVGEWRQAALEHGLHFGVSSHADRTWQWFNASHGHDSTEPGKGVPYDGNLTKREGEGTWWEGYDPQDLYGRPHAGDPLLPDETYMQRGTPPDTAFKEKWFKRTLQLIDDYHPDLLYFDSPLPLGDYGLRIAAHFYSATPTPVLNIKSWGPGTVPDEGAIVLDIEKGQSDQLRPHPWQTDTSLNENWFIDDQPLELSDEVVVHNLCDIVSKNGNLLLNVSLRADGTLPDDQRAILEHVGSWLKQNGEAIYGTRPWRIYGEGPTQVATGAFKQNTRPLTAADIRFTTRHAPIGAEGGDTLYAIFMGWPADAILRIRSLSAARSVELLGCATPLTWDSGPDGVIVHLPAAPVGRFAYVLRIKQS